jgi:hypothetical protein
VVNADRCVDRSHATGGKDSTHTADKLQAINIPEQTTPNILPLHGRGQRGGYCDEIVSKLCRGSDTKEPGAGASMHDDVCPDVQRCCVASM